MSEYIYLRDADIGSLVLWRDCPVTVKDYDIYMDEVKVYEESQTFAPESLRHMTKPGSSRVKPITKAEYMINEAERWLGRLSKPEKDKIREKYPDA